MMMKKFKVFTDFSAEEAYLNEMARQGYFLKKYSAWGVYHFTEGTPKDLHYHIDYRYFKSRAEFENYKTLFEDAGWRHVYGTKYSQNQYFLPQNDQSDASIFSTEESAAQRYKHLYRMCLVNIAAVILYVLATLISYDFNLSNMAFLTPGLWEKTGGQFWSAFMFELPFAFLRIVPMIFFAALGITYAVWASRAKKTYQSIMGRI